MHYLAQKGEDLALHLYSFLIFFLYVCAGMESRALGLLDKHSATEPHSSLLPIFKRQIKKGQAQVSWKAGRVPISALLQIPASWAEMEPHTCPGQQHTQGFQSQGCTQKGDASLWP